MTPDEYEALIAQGMDPQDINRPGGVNLGGLPNVGNGTPGFRNQRQRQAVGNLHAQGDDEPDAPEGPQRATRRPFNMQPYSQSHLMNPALIAQQASSEQARHLNGMIDDVTAAYQDENDSRVAQMREQRRMEHETEMESMQQDALLQRLAMEQQEREKDRILQRQLTSGITTRKLVNGGWVDV